MGKPCRAQIPRGGGTTGRIRRLRQVPGARTEGGGEVQGQGKAVDGGPASVGYWSGGCWILVWRVLDIGPVGVGYWFGGCWIVD